MQNDECRMQNEEDAMGTSNSEHRPQPVETFKVISQGATVGTITNPRNDMMLYEAQFSASASESGSRFVTRASALKPAEVIRDWTKGFRVQLETADAQKWTVIVLGLTDTTLDFYWSANNGVISNIESTVAE